MSVFLLCLMLNGARSQAVEIGPVEITENHLSNPAEVYDLCDALTGDYPANALVLGGGE